MGFNKTVLAILGLSALLAGFAGHEAGHAQSVSVAPSPKQESKSESAPPSQIPEGIMTLHASLHLVILDVSVFDWKDSPVTGLTKGAFQIFEDGHEQSIRNLEEHAPIDPAVAPVDSIAYTTGIDVDGTQLARLMQTGVTFDQTIAIPVAGNPLPGHFFLRIGVHEITTDHIGVVEIPTEWIKLPTAQITMPKQGAARTPSINEGDRP